MAIYYFVLLFLPMAYFVSIARSSQSNRMLLIGAMLTATIISGMRWASDVDHPDYVEMFLNNPDLANFNSDSIRALHGEPGYLLVSALFKSIGLNFVALSVICAIFSLAAKALIAYRFSPNSALVFCLYLCIHFITIEFIQIRWAVATGLIAVALYYQFKDKFVIAALLFGVAIFFHYFSIVFVMVFVAARIKREIHFNLAIGVASLVGIALAATGFALSESYGSEIYVIRRAFRYLFDPQSGVGVLSYAKLAMFPIAYYYLAKFSKQVPEDASIIFLRRVAFSSLALTLLLSFVPLMHFRAVVIADLFSLILIVRMTDILKSKFDKAIILIIFSALYAIWYVIDVANYIAADRLYEYKTWLQLYI